MVRQITGFGAVAVLLMGIGCRPSAPTDYSVELRPIIDAYVEAWNTGNVDQLDSIIATNFQRRGPASADSDANNLDELKALIGRFRTAFPDGKVTIDGGDYLDNRSVVRWTYTGTNTGEGQFAATGKKVSISGVSVGRYEEGKLVEEAVYFDNLDFMTQLGFTLTPPEGETGSDQ